MQILKALITAIRPVQWTKNFLVLAAPERPAFALATELEVWRAVGSTFVIFCSVSSATYLANDLFDVEQDRLHGGTGFCSRNRAGNSTGPLLRANSRSR